MMLLYFLIFLNVAGANAQTSPSVACQNIQLTCTRAGFTSPSEDHRKNLYLDCVIPLLNKEKVADINHTNSAEIESCRQTVSRPTTDEKRCPIIYEACLSAGFQRLKSLSHQELSMNSYESCFKPVLDGKEIPGVRVAQHQITLCKVALDEPFLRIKTGTQLKVQ